MGMIELGNYCAFFNHLIAVQAPFITGITLGFLSSGYSASYLGVDVIVGGKVAVLNSANLAFRFGMTCGFAADVGSYIELCTEIADMPMICTIGFPLPIRIYMLACSRNLVTYCNFSIAVRTPNVASIALFTTGSFFCIARLCMFVIRGIN